MSHLIYNVKTLVYVVPFSIIIVVYFSITIYTCETFLPLCLEVSECFRIFAK